MEATSIGSIEYLLGDIIEAQLNGEQLQLQLPEKTVDPGKQTKPTNRESLSTFEMLQIIVAILTVLVLISQLVRK